MHDKAVPAIFQTIEIGESIPIKNGYTMQMVEANHRLECYGAMITHRKNKLKAEYADRSKNEIIEAKKNGRQINNEITTDLFAYSADTDIKILEMNPTLYECKNLILECTFLEDDELDSARKTQHTHINDILEREKFFQNDKLILSHFSTRYQKKEVVRILNEKLKNWQGPEIVLWI